MKTPTSTPWTEAKIQEDTYYRHLYQQSQSLEEIVAAGFFDDKLPLLEKTEPWRKMWAATPLHKICAELKQKPPFPGEKLAIIMTTGGFAPLHQGHLNMMQIAQETLENHGWRVVGSYLSPAHDAYVQTKDSINKPNNAYARIMACQQATASHPLLAVDTWEALIAPKDLNFTDVYEHLWQCMERQWPEYVRRPGSFNFEKPTANNIIMAPFYVFGGDNVEFLKAFSAKGYGVAISRDYHDENDIEKTKNLSDRWNNTLNDSIIRLNSNRLFLAENHTGTQHLSSRNFRQNFKSSAVTASNQACFLPRWPHLDAYNPNIQYVVRNDLSWGLQNICKNVEQEVLNQASQLFLTGLHQLFTEYVFSKNQNIQPDIIYLDLSSQSRQVEQLNTKHKTINLDVCTHNLGSFDLHVGRWFWPSTHQERAVAWASREGKASLAQQTLQIPPGDYCYIDDDVASGSTLYFIKEILPPHAKFTHWMSLVDWSLAQNEIAEPQEWLMETVKIGWPRSIEILPNSSSQKFYDIVDARDFLIGTKSGGLKVGLANNLYGRTIYASPYVDLASRAKIPWENQLMFNRQLWHLNLQFWQTIEKRCAINLCHTDQEIQNFWIYNGYDKKTSLRQICEDQIQRFI